MANHLTKYIWMIPVFYIKFLARLSLSTLYEGKRIFNVFIACVNVLNNCWVKPTNVCRRRFLSTAVEAFVRGRGCSTRPKWRRSFSIRTTVRRRSSCPRPRPSCRKASSAVRLFLVSTWSSPTPTGCVPWTSSSHARADRGVATWWTGWLPFSPNPGPHVFDKSGRQTHRQTDAATLYI